MAITYKQLKTLDELRPCETLQEAVWGFDQTDTIPARFMLVLHKHGGFAMGAFDGDKMVGFVFGVPAIHYGLPSQHSHMMAVLPEYRDLNIGYNLKIAQRKDALARNIDLVTWTFDPLQSRNAHLNIDKLGIIACTYEINFYGEQTSSKLHSGLGTDRLLAEWWIAGDKVKSIIDGCIQETLEKHPIKGTNINITKRDKLGLLVPVDSDLTLTKDVLLLEIPDNIDNMKKANLYIAQQWREHVQRVLVKYFSAGYYINRFKVAKEDEYRRTYYVLERLDKPYKTMTRD